jgi:hypothetical protein
MARYIDNLYAWHQFTTRDPNSFRLRDARKDPKSCVLFEDTRYEVYAIPEGYTADDVLDTYIQNNEETITYEDPVAGLVGLPRPHLV